VRTNGRASLAEWEKSSLDLLLGCGNLLLARHDPIKRRARRLADKIASDALNRADRRGSVLFRGAKGTVCLALVEITCNIV